MSDTAFPQDQGRLVIRPRPTQQKTLPLPLRIQVTDRSFRLVAKGFGTLEQLLPGGVYRVQVESRVAPFEQNVFIRPGHQETIEYDLPQDEQLPSAAPVPGSESMQKNIFEALAQDWEKLRRELEDEGSATGPTFHHPPPLDLPKTPTFKYGASGTAPEAAAPKAPPQRKNAYLLLVFTAVDPIKFNLRGIRLLSPQGRVRARIARRARTGRLQQCTTALVRMRPSGCVLEWPDDLVTGKRLRQSLWIPEDWCTVVFAGIQPETGRLNPDKLSIYHWAPQGDLSFLLSKNLSQPANMMERDLAKSLQSTELAQESLHTRRQLLDGKKLQNLLEAKFQNPMLGILGCHMLLQRSEIDHGLVQEVIRNLDRLVPGHPDVAALKILADQKDVPIDLPPPPPLPWPPMLRAGMAAAVEMDWDASASGKTIEPGTLMHHVRSRVFSGGLWTRWQGSRGMGDPEFKSPPHLQSRFPRLPRALPIAVTPPAPDSPPSPPLPSAVSRSALPTTSQLSETLPSVAHSLPQGPQLTLPPSIHDVPGLLEDISSHFQKKVLDDPDWPPLLQSLSSYRDSLRSPLLAKIKQTTAEAIQEKYETWIADLINNPELQTRITSFISELQKAGKTPTPEDLRWTGLNQVQLGELLAPHPPQVVVHASFEPPPPSGVSSFLLTLPTEAQISEQRIGSE